MKARYSSTTDKSLRVSRTEKMWSLAAAALHMSVNGEFLSMVTGDENNNSHEDDEGVKEEQYEQD